MLPFVGSLDSFGALFHLGLTIGSAHSGVLSLRNHNLTAVPELQPTLNSLDLSENLLGENGNPLNLPPLPSLVELRLARASEAQRELAEDPPSPLTTPDKPISTAGTAPPMKRRPQHATRLFA